MSVDLGTGSVPVVPARAIDRPELVERLEQAIATCRVVLLVAPAGYGKSVLLAQWLAAHPERRVAYLALTTEDDDPAVFRRRLVAALATVQPGVEGLVRAHRRPRSRANDGFLVALADQLRAGDGVTLVVEDAEVLSTTSSLEDLVELAGEVGPGFTLVVASRLDLLETGSRLWLRDEVTEIRQAALEMDDHDAAALVRLVGHVELTPDQVAALQARTEGWAAGIQLAAVSMRDHDDPDLFIAEFAGSSRHVAEYLTAEVLEHQPAELMEFLVHCSVLRTLNGDLCDAVTGRSGSQRTLEQLAAAAVFVRPLDVGRTWFEIHPLLRDLLRSQLRLDDPPAIARDARRAAMWHRNRGDLELAIEHFSLAEDWDGVLDLVRQCAPRYFDRSEVDMLRRWLDRIPTELVLADPDLGLALVALRTMAGYAVAADDLLVRVEQAADLDWYHEVVAAAARACWVYHHRSGELAAQSARTALELLDAHAAEGLPRPPLLGLLDESVLRLIALVSGASAERQLGHDDEARRLLDQVDDQRTNTVWRIHALGERAILEAIAGHLRDSTVAAGTALRLAEGAELSDHTAVAAAHLALAHVERCRGEDASASLAEGLRAAEQRDRWNLVALGRVVEAEVALSEGRFGDGLAALERVDVTGRSLPVLEARRVAVEARLHLQLGHTDLAAHLLAEHRGLAIGDLRAARAQLASAQHGATGLRKELDAWPEDDGRSLTDQLHRGLWEAMLLELEGAGAAAVRRMGEVVVEAEPEHHVRLFLDAGNGVKRLLRPLHRDQPTPFLRALVDGPALAPGTSGGAGLVEPLSERELAVLQHLPSRLSNAEIASLLFVSVNTLKTHLKAIYRKLDVTSRSAAITKAEEIGLL